MPPTGGIGTHERGAMTEEILRELQQFQRYAAGLQGLIADAEGMAPRSAEGADSSGVVHVTIGSDGLPESIRVDSDWDRKLEPDAFGDAVVQAFQAAMGERLSAWTQTLQEDGWQGQVDRLQADVDRRPPAAAPGEIPAAFRRPATTAKPRGLGELTEDMIKAFDNVEQLARPATAATGTGTAASGKLVLTLSQHGLVACEAEPRWVSDQTAARLMNALGEALAEAKAELAELAGEPEPARPLDRLLGEVLALLNDPRRLAES
jgi:DNA-binding protein YbaB